MAIFNLLHGYNKSDGTDKLIGAWYGRVITYNPITNHWDRSTTPAFAPGNICSATNFLDYMFVIDYRQNFCYDGSTWSSSTNLSDSPVAKYIENQGVYLFLGNIILRGTAYPSRVWISDLPKSSGSITWGLETGSDLSQLASSAAITSAGSLFVTRNIKTGDKLVIENGNNAGDYTVRSVDSETQLTLTQTLSNTVSNSNFWVGSNWVDVKTNDGDVLTGFGKNSNEVLFFKKNSLHRFNPTSKTLRQVKEVKGTTSSRSIVNMNEYTYYFYPKVGILRYDGTTSLILSNGIEDLIQGISSSMYTEVVGWSVDSKLVEFYLGNVMTRDGDSIAYCCATWDTITETWALRSLPFGIENKTEWYQDDVPNTYLVTTDGKILKVGDGYTYAGTNIAFSLEDRVIFPEGSDVIVDFQRLRLFIENGLDMQVMYKLYYKPTSDPKRWDIDKDWHSLKGRANGDLVEFVFDDEKQKRARGIKLKFIQSSGDESFLIEKYILYYSNPSIR
jgi:hypothetical protein